VSQTEDVYALLRHLYDLERKHQDEDGLFVSKDLAEELAWSPKRLNSAFQVLNDARQVEADPSMGSTPFSTHSFRLSERGILFCETNHLDSPPQGEATTMPAASPDPKKVFIIHGRNTAARTAVEHFVKALGLEPIDFDQLSGDAGGSAFVGDIVRAGLEQAMGLIALFTPEEFASLRPDHRGEHEKPEDLQRWQARPNVIFEAGMAYGMARERTVLVTMGAEVALFSDVAGVHVVRLRNSVESRKKLRQKLIGMKCAVDLRNDAWTDPARSGDFDSCVTQLSEVSPRDPF
jgi:predicted nucleotide-binding protein